MVLPRLFDILAWPSSPRIRFAAVSSGCGSGKNGSPPPNSAFQRRAMLPGQLEVLGLVLAHRHLVGPVQQDVGRHQDRVAEQPGRDRSIRCDLSLNWVIRSSSPSGATVVSSHIELGVLRHVATARRAPRASGSSPAASSPIAISRVRSARAAWSYWPVMRVQVHDAVEAVVAILQRDPVLDRAQPVADVQFAGGLDAGEDGGHGGKLPAARKGGKMTRDAERLARLAERAAGAAAAYLRRAAPPGPAAWTAKGHQRLRHRGRPHRRGDHHRDAAAGRARRPDDGRGRESRPDRRPGTRSGSSTRSTAPPTSCTASRLGRLDRRGGRRRPGGRRGLRGADACGEPPAGAGGGAWCDGQPAPGLGASPIPATP